MAPRPIAYVHGATAPRLEITVLRAGAVVNLTGVTAVTAYVRREGGLTLTKAAAIDPVPTTGIVRITWAAGDLVANGLLVATYEVELKLESPAGIEFTPDPVRFTVRPRL